MNRFPNVTTKLAAVVLMCATFSSPANAGKPTPSRTVISDWNENAVTAITAADGYANPLQATRVLAMVHVAMHDAVNGVISRYERYDLRARIFTPTRGLPLPRTASSPARSRRSSPTSTQGLRIRCTGSRKALG